MWRVPVARHTAAPHTKLLVLQNDRGATEVAKADRVRIAYGINILTGGWPLDRLVCMAVQQTRKNQPRTQSDEAVN